MSETIRREKLKVDKEDEFLFNFTNFIGTLKELTRAEKTVLFFILKKQEDAVDNNIKINSKYINYLIEKTTYTQSSIYCFIQTLKRKGILKKQERVRYYYSLHPELFGENFPKNRILKMTFIFDFKSKKDYIESLRSTIEEEDIIRRQIALLEEQLKIIQGCKY